MACGRVLPVIRSVIDFTQDWWDYVKNQMDKPGFDKKQMERMYDEMRTSLGDDAVGHGAFRRKFIQV